MIVIKIIYNNKKKKNSNRKPKCGPHTRDLNPKPKTFLERPHVVSNLGFRV